MSRRHHITIGAALAALLSTPMALPYIEKALSLHEDWIRLHTRVENAEQRLDRLERRGRFFHGRETTEEVKAEGVKQ